MKQIICFLFYFLGTNLATNANSGTFEGKSHELSLEPVTLSLGDGFTRLFSLTTYDDNLTTFPLTDSGVSGELKKVESNYRADYIVSVLETEQFQDWGSITLSLPNSDMNSNGLNDILEFELSTNASVTGNWFSKFGDSGGISGSFTRTANQAAGTYQFTLFNTFAGTLVLTGTYFVGFLDGDVEYNPLGNSIDLEFNSTRDGFIYSGQTTYQVINQNSIRLFEMVIQRQDGKQIQVPETVYVRNRDDYSATIAIPDGGPDTFWPDYQNWTLHIRDGNDSDLDGVPDITDIEDNLAPVITLNGAAILTLEAGIDNYVEPGATVTDDDPAYSGTVKYWRGYGRC